MKIDPHNWQSFKKNEPVITTDKTSTVRLAEPGAIYAKDDKTKTLIGYGTEFKIELPPGYDLVADVPGVIHRRALTTAHATGETYTNADKRPILSPAEQAVTVALRQLKRKQKQLDDQSAELFAQMKNERKKLGLEPGDPDPEPLPDNVDPETGEVLPEPDSSVAPSDDEAGNPDGAK